MSNDKNIKLKLNRIKKKNNDNDHNINSQIFSNDIESNFTFINDEIEKNDLDDKKKK